MKPIPGTKLLIACGLLYSTQGAWSDAPLTADTAPADWFTNRAAVYKLERHPVPPFSPEPPEAFTQKIFHHFLPDSFNYLVWTNFIAHTNGSDMKIWISRSHSVDWPAHPPTVIWNTNSLMWGMKGITGISPCWENESGVGQVPVTALTRRHAYARGHGMGPAGFNSNFAGKKIWFATTDNTVVEAIVLRNVVRTYTDARRDYTILLLTKDLPDGIDPLRVTSASALQPKFMEYGIPRPVFKTEQTGQVSAEVLGWTVNTMKGGDSGSPDMVPIPGELIFMGGRNTSGPSPEMQADIDELSKSANLDPKQYQLKWLDLSVYPSY